MDQLPRLGKRELICLLLFTCNYVVSVWRGFLFLWVLGMGYVILLWHSLSLHIIILIVHYSFNLANIQDILSKSNSSLYCLQVCSIIFQINTLDSFIIVKKPKDLFSLFSALFEENNQNLVKNEGINCQFYM